MVKAKHELVAIERQLEIISVIKYLFIAVINAEILVN